MPEALDDELPVLTVDVLAGYVFAAADSLEKAEAICNPELALRHIEHARTTLDFLDHLRRSGRVDVLVEARVNAALVNVRRKLNQLANSLQPPPEQP